MFCPIPQRFIYAGLPAVACSPELLQYFRIQAKRYLLFFPAPEWPTWASSELPQLRVRQGGVVLVGKGGGCNLRIFGVAGSN
jgi:hypothetical protein